jgi:hypothetical protein
MERIITTNERKQNSKINTFKYHVSRTDGKISVVINLLFYLFFHRRPIQHMSVPFLLAFRR